MRGSLVWWLRSAHQGVRCSHSAHDMCGHSVGHEPKSQLLQCIGKFNNCLFRRASDHSLHHSVAHVERAMRAWQGADARGGRYGEDLWSHRPLLRSRGNLPPQQLATREPVSVPQQYATRRGMPCRVPFGLAAAVVTCAVLHATPLPAILVALRLWSMLWIHQRIQLHVAGDNLAELTLRWY